MTKRETWRGGREPLRVWYEYVGYVRATLLIAEQLRLDRPGLEEHWQVLYPGQEEYASGIMSWPPFPQQVQLAFNIRKWMNEAGIQWSFDWHSDSAQPELRLALTTWGNLVWQMAVATSDMTGYRHCPECKELFRRQGRALFCWRCRKAHAPEKHRQRRARARRRAPPPGPQARARHDEERE